MRAIAPLATALALTIATLAPASARPMAGGEARKMQTAVNVYLGAIDRGEADRVVAALPPRIKNIFAGSAGIEAGQLDRTLTAQTAALLKSANFSDFNANFTGVEATDSVLSDGTTVTWVIVPTSFKAATAKGKTLNEQPLLAVNEGGSWYMMRVEGAQQKQLVSIAYPFLQNVSFPQSRVSPVN
ncbi:hypothetical protein [Frigidibacter sp. MR17.24]|uniref:hypothetical protein n=1 Tax=Frigidibacter sp. MR17.24 TaxID=3127345 RepID=UPI003012B245